MRKDKPSPVHRIIVFFLLVLFRATFGVYIRVFYRLRSESRKFLPKNGTYLLLANHCNNYDGLFLQCLIPETISFVVTDAMFKNKTLGKLMAYVGYIPKRKNVTDSGAIRRIIRAAKQNRIVGIFPEGGRNWDGQTGPISPATFRLIKMLGIPVVTARIKGSYLSEPRWAETKRRGIVEIDFKLHYADGVIPSLKTVEQEISASLAHDEAAWQNEKQVPFKGKALGKGLDRLIFTCPTCEILGAMRSSEDRLTCLECKASYRIDEFGYLNGQNGTHVSQNINEINAWQQNLLARKFDHADTDAVLLTDEGACLYCAEAQNAPFEPEDKGTLTLTKTELSIGSHRFDIHKIHGVAVYFKTHLEFRYDGLDRRIGFDGRHISAYKWESALRVLKNEAKEN